jgi:purine nucleosidase
MTRMARKHPGELAIVATGPLTNLALACRLDPDFPRLVKELIFVGGRFMPFSRTGTFTRCPSRREVNFRHDPEAAHIVLQANWNRLVCLPRDLTDPIRVTAEMHEALAKARTPLGRFVKGLKHDLYAKGDALAAAVCADPGLILDRDAVCLDVDLDPHGANYGQLLNWRDLDHAPAHHGPPVEVVTSINEKAFAQAFVRWCSAKPARTTKPRSFNAKVAKRAKT